MAKRNKKDASFLPFSPLWLILSGPNGFPVMVSIDQRKITGAILDFKKRIDFQSISKLVAFLKFRDTCPTLWQTGKSLASKELLDFCYFFWGFIE